jgi:hypothetical protein
MMRIKADKEFELRFKVDVKGSKETPETRFVFEMANGIKVAFPGQKSGKLVNVPFPTLDSLGIFAENESLDAKLEVIVEGNYFVPWEDKVQLLQPIRVSAESIEPEGGELEEEHVEAHVNAPVIIYKKTLSEESTALAKLKRIKRDQFGKPYTEERVGNVLTRKFK